MALLAMGKTIAVEHAAAFPFFLGSRKGARTYAS